MKEYIKLANDKAYHLLNPGGLLIISTVSKMGDYNMAPIAWHSPIDFDPVTRMLFVTDKEHQTFKNIEETLQFAACVMHATQLKAIKELGSVSGKNENKIEKFGIKTFDSELIDCKLIANCIGFLECKVYNIILDSTVALVFGEVTNAGVDKEAYNARLLAETEAGKILHHLSGKVFLPPSDTILM